MGRRGIVAFLDEGDHTGERAPVVELGARAVTAVVVGRLVQREILADVPVLPPLRESSKLVICLQRAFRPERTMGTCGRTPITSKWERVSHATPGTQSWTYLEYLLTYLE